ncbi:MAG: sarcosine oxidase subunit gamma [Rhodospirillaceae bacterium]|nr:sarcosine oxidase subunit gamma [Rhodospirillaceae bacterium]MBL6942106.1 sarcosine oxidase subunit gamma [Rhodospirillales bacterium]
MVERVSALSGHYSKTSHDNGSVTFTEIEDLSLIQLAAWPDTLALVAAKAVDIIGAQEAPGPGRAVSTHKGTLLRIEPLKWWLVECRDFALSSDPLATQGAVLDVSHSRTQLRISGPQAALLLNRHLPLDLRDAAFPVGTVASTAFHHTGVTLWRSEQGYELFMIRGFALSLWELLRESGAQFNAEIA